MVVLLLALASQAADPRLARWQAVDPPVVVEPDGTRALWVPWADGSVIGLRCKHGRPGVVGMSKGARIRMDLLSPGQEVGTWQITPSAAVRWSGFIVRDARCQVERRRTSAMPWSWALSEADGRIEEERPALTSPAAAAWAAEEPLNKAALRPPGPHPVGARPAWAGRDRVVVDARDWVVVEADEDVHVDGPARVRVDLRALGQAPSTCILLDGELLCQPSAPARAVSVEADEGEPQLRYGPRQLPDGTAIQNLVSWQIAVGAGSHRLRMDRDALARVVVHRVEAFGGASPSSDELAASEGVAVWTPPPRLEWGTAEFADLDTAGEGRWLVRDLPAPKLDGLAWQPVDDVHPFALLASAGEVSLWLEPDADDALCTLRIGEERYTALAPRGVHRFGWVGPSQVERPEIEAQGCRAWLHTQGATRPASRSLAYLQVLELDDLTEVQTDASLPARLEVALPLDGVAREIRALASDGRVLRFVVEPPSEAAGRHDEQGGAWTDAFYLPLPRASRWQLSVDGPTAMRIRQPIIGEVPESKPDHPFPIGPRGAARFDGPAPSAYRVRALTSRLPEATDDGERAELLVQRGGLLAARRSWTLAARDLLRAEELDPDTEGLSTAVGRGLRLARERTLYGPDAWRPSQPVWILLDGAEPSQVEARLAGLAARGDYLGVATRLSGSEAARWWRRAILGGQVLTAEQRLQAFVVAAELPEHPDLQVLRSGTRWDGVHLIEGAARRKAVRWPLQRDSDDDLLYPDEWPEDRLVPLRRGWLLRIPARAEGQALHLRCLVRALATTGPCRFVAEDARGKLVASALISGWGEPDALWLPPGPAVYLRLDEPFGAHAQLLWTRPGEVPGLERLAHEALPGRTLSATILGPTAVRAHVRPLGTDPVDVRVRVGDQIVNQVIVDEGEVIVPVLDEGPHRVRVSVSGRAWVRLATRRPVRGGPIAAQDRRAVARAGMDVDAEPERAQARLPIPAPAIGMPAGRPARTWTAGLTVGSAEWTPAESRGPVGAPPATTLTAGLQAQAREELWLEADGSVQARIDGAVIGVLHGGGDWRLTRGRTRVYGIGDLDLATGPFADRVIGTARMDLGTRVVHPVWRGGTLQGRAELRGRLRTALDPTLAYEPNKGRLWSRYAEDHPLQISASATLRHRFGPWIVARGGVYTVSNAPNDALPIDLVGAETSVDLSREALFTRLGTGLELRFLDAHRKDAFVSWVLDGRVRWFRWIGARTGVHPWAGVRWRPTDRKASVMVGVEGRFGAPRALRDVRPSRLASRHVGEWSFWERAHERWPVSGASDEADDDWTPPPIEPVEVAP